MFAFEAREMHFGKRSAHAYARCEVCGALQLEDLDFRLVADYPSDYYAHQPVRDPPALAGLPQVARRQWTRARLAAPKLLRPFSGQRFARFDWFTRTGTRIDAAILDVGCGSGRLLWRLARAGFSDLTGIDPGLPEACVRDGSPRLLRMALEDFEGRADLLMAHHSFEHAADPRDAFAHYRRLTAKGGALLLRVPRVDSWAARHYGRDWVQLDAPRHRFVPTVRSIEALAHEFDFELEAIVDDSGPFQIWGSELYRRGIALSEAAGRMSPWSLRGLRARARMRAWALRRRGVGDQACFYLRRSGAGRDA